MWVAGLERLGGQNDAGVLTHADSNRLCRQGPLKHTPSLEATGTASEPPPQQSSSCSSACLLDPFYRHNPVWPEDGGASHLPPLPSAPEPSQGGLGSRGQAPAHMAPGVEGKAVGDPRGSRVCEDAHLPLGVT